jgi:hypothetical protein
VKLIRLTSFIGYTDIVNLNRTRTDPSYFLHVGLLENGEGIETLGGNYLHGTLYTFSGRENLVIC